MIIQTSQWEEKLKGIKSWVRIKNQSVKIPRLKDLATKELILQCHCCMNTATGKNPIHSIDLLSQIKCYLFKCTYVDTISSAQIKSL